MKKPMWTRMALGLAAGLAMAAFSASKAQGGSITLGTSGWQASWSASQDGVLDLAVDAVTGTGVYIEKAVNFLPSSINESGAFINAALITFQRISPDAQRYIVLNDESLTNHTGLAWTGFRFFLMTGNASFDVGRSAVGQVGGFSIDPFTTYQFIDQNTELRVGGGLLPSTSAGENVWFPGAAVGGLVIDTNGSDSFVLKEQPISAIPLPAALWSGLSGLCALGILGSLRRRKRIA